MNLEVNGAFIYFTIPIFGGIPITQTTVSSLVVALILIAASVKLGKNLQKRPTGVQVLVEKGVSMIYNLTVSVMGKHTARWTPFMGTIVLRSICGSLINAMAILTRRCQPPDNLPAFLFKTVPSANWVASSSILLFVFSF